MTPPTPPPGAAPIAALRASLRSTAGWILRVLLWGTAVIGAACVGGPLAVLGFSGVALVVALALVALGATTWRRAGLPLSLTAAALALTAAIVAAQPVRIASSHGLLIAKPKSPKDVKQEYRRGVGNVVVDLRDFRARPGSITTINARSDTGRVVVALPRGRCFNLRVDLARGRGGDAVLFEAPLALARSVAGYSTGVPTLHGQSGAWESYPTDGSPPESPTRLIAFGRTVFTNGFGGDSQPLQWSRASPRREDPMLQINADVATDLIVRDYPSNAGPAFSIQDPIRVGRPLADGAYAYGYTDPTQVSDLSWPEMVQVPFSPGERRLRQRWLPNPPTAERAAAQRRLWAPWFERARAAAQRRSELGAGSCSSSIQRSTYWTRFSWTVVDRQGMPRGTGYAVAVNGLGEARLYRDSYTSSSPDFVDLKPGDNPFTNPALLKELAS